MIMLAVMVQCIKINDHRGEKTFVPYLSRRILTSGNILVPMEYSNINKDLKFKALISIIHVIFFT
jgi:hypothetical protein